MFGLFGIDDALMGGIIAGGGGMLGGLFGKNDEPEYQAPTRYNVQYQPVAFNSPEYNAPEQPQWLQDSYSQAWNEISAPASYGQIPQSYIDSGVGDIEKMYADYMQGETYNYNTNNMMDSGIYENYLTDTGKQQSEALGKYMSNIDYQNALMKSNAEQNRLSNMSGYIGDMGNVYGTPLSSSMNQYNTAYNNAINEYSAASTNSMNQYNAARDKYNAESGNSMNQYNAALNTQTANTASSGALGSGIGDMLGMYTNQNQTPNYANISSPFNQYTSGLGDYTSNMYSNKMLGYGV